MSGLNSLKGLWDDDAHRKNLSEMGYSAVFDLN